MINNEIYDKQRELENWLIDNIPSNLWFHDDYQTYPEVIMSFDRKVDLKNIEQSLYKKLQSNQFTVEMIEIEIYEEATDDIYDLRFLLDLTLFENSEQVNICLELISKLVEKY